MIEENNIYNLFQKHAYLDLANSYSTDQIANSLSFREGLLVAYKLLYNNDWNEDFQIFAVNLLYEISKIYPNEWNACWKYDALLGLACDITSQHEKRYRAYKKAFDKAVDPPPRLLIELARCSVCPGRPPISYDEAITLVKKALAKANYSDGISLLCNLYSLKGDAKQLQYFSQALEASDLNFNSPSIEPDFLISM